MNNKNNKTQRIENIAKAALLAGGLAASSMADAIVITEINNYVDQGKIEFNIYDDTGLGLLGATFLDFYGGDLLKTDVTSFTGDINNVPFGNFLSMNDLNGDGTLYGEIFYSLINTPLNIFGDSGTTLVDNGVFQDRYHWAPVEYRKGFPGWNA